jgi:hypothetical protein
MEEHLVEKRAFRLLGGHDCHSGESQFRCDATSNRLKQHQIELALHPKTKRLDERSAAQKLAITNSESQII